MMQADRSNRVGAPAPSGDAVAGRNRGDPRAATSSAVRAGLVTRPRVRSGCATGCGRDTGRGWPWVSSASSRWARRAAPMTAAMSPPGALRRARRHRLRRPVPPAPEVRRRGRRRKLRTRGIQRRRRRRTSRPPPAADGRLRRSATLAAVVGPGRRGSGSGEGADELAADAQHGADSPVRTWWWVAVGHAERSRFTRGVLRCAGHRERQRYEPAEHTMPPPCGPRPLTRRRAVAACQPDRPRTMRSSCSQVRAPASIPWPPARWRARRMTM